MVFRPAGFRIFAVLENSLDLVRSTDGLQPLLHGLCIYVLSTTLLQSVRCRTEQNGAVRNGPELYSYVYVSTCWRERCPQRRN
jgi:hypothetical protein